MTTFESLAFQTKMVINVTLLTLLVSVTCDAVMSTSRFDDVVFVILSQSHPRHRKISDETKKILKQNLLQSGASNPRIFDLHNDFTVEGGWSVIPLLPFLNHHAEGSKWFVFLAENSRVRLDLLQDIFSQFDSDYGIFLGYAVNGYLGVDAHPDPNAGFAMSRELIKLYHNCQVMMAVVVAQG